MLDLLGDDVAAVVRAAAPAQRGVVAARPPTLESHSRRSDDLNEYLNQLSQLDPSIAEFGLTLEWVELRSVVAAQSIVALDDPRVDALDARATVAELLSLCVPQLPEVMPSAAYDSRNQAWVVRARNSKIEVAGRYHGPLEDDPGALVFGFVVSAQPSRMTVRRNGDRLILRDGHHRALALLRRGLSEVPMLVHHGPMESLPDRGALPGAALTDLRAPTLADYLDDDVSVACEVPLIEHVVTISAAELQLPT